MEILGKNVLNTDANRRHDENANPYSSVLNTQIKNSSLKVNLGNFAKSWKANRKKKFTKEEHTLIINSGILLQRVNSKTKILQN